MAYNPVGGNNGSTTGASSNADQRDLFVKKFSTDVLKYFMDTNIIKEKNYK